MVRLVAAVCLVHALSFVAGEPAANNSTVTIDGITASQTLLEAEAANVTTTAAVEEIEQEEPSLFIPAEAQGNIITVNHTRYRIHNVEVAGNRIGADIKDYPDRASLLHPNFWTYCIHLAFQFVVAFMALKCPKILLWVLIAAVLVWPISAIFNQNIWSMVPFASDWWLMCVKSLIVNICPTFPMLWCLINKSNKKMRQRAGMWTYGILWANVAWTLFFLSMTFNTVSCVNAVCGVSLLISLIIHNVALLKKGKILFEVEGDIIYGYGTSLSWVVCYTVWNAIFVSELAVGLTFQDIAFWAMMIFFWYWSDKRSGVENYFAMARPISLSAYIATSDWPGLIDYFRKADGLGLDLTSHAFFLFITICNVVFSFYVLYWAVCLLTNGKGAKQYFKETFQYQDQMLDQDSESDPVSSE